jgi:cold shock CspA family protein
MATSPSNPETEQYSGVVKWFNNKSGYGFIKSIDDENDIFVHHSKIVVENEQFKYLVQGEYVSFNLEYSNDENAKHKYQAVNIRGIKGGKLMCETRNETRPSEPRPKTDVQRRRSYDDNSTRQRRTYDDENVLRRRRSYAEEDDRYNRNEDETSSPRRHSSAPYKKKYEVKREIPQEQSWRVVRKSK